MKKFLPYIIILVALAGILSPTLNARAQTGSATDPLGTCSGQTSPMTQSACTAANPKATWLSYYYLLSPLPCAPGSSPGCVNGMLQSFDASTPASGAPNTRIGEYLNLMIGIIIGIAAVMAVVMIVIGGIEYMTSELISNKESGKERITHAIFGLVLALCAWTLLYTINPNILISDPSSFTTQTVTVNNPQADTGPQTPTIVNGVSMYGGYVAGSNFAADFPQNSLATLPAGVTVCASNGQCGAGAQCVTVGQQNCTSTLGLVTTNINSIESGCTQSNNGNTCPITITAGTEFWLHSANTTHQPGNATMDLSATSALTSYITGGTSTFPTGTTISSNGICYYAEPAGATSSTTGPHWHVYTPSSGSCNVTN